MYYDPTRQAAPPPGPNAPRPMRPPNKVRIMGTLVPTWIVIVLALTPLGAITFHDLRAVGCNALNEQTMRRANAAADFATTLQIEEQLRQCPTVWP